MCSRCVQGGSKLLELVSGQWCVYPLRAAMVGFGLKHSLNWAWVLTPSTLRFPDGVWETTGEGSETFYINQYVKHVANQSSVSRDVQHVLFWNSLTRWQWYSLSREEVQDLEDKSFEWENECWSFAFVQRISTDLQSWSTYMEALTLEQVRVVIAAHYMDIHPNRVCAFGRFRDADGWV